MSLRKIATAALLAIASVAQPARAAETETVSFSAVCFSPNVAKEPTFFVPSGGSREKISIPNTSLGGPFKGSVREGGLMDFFTSETDKAPALSVKLPSGSREGLLLVFVPAGNETYQARAVILPANGFSGGTTFAINVAPMDIAIRHGSNPMQTIKPGAHDLLTLPAGHRDPMLPVQIFTRGSTGTWEVAQSTRWAVDRRFRSYLFLYKSPENGNLAIHAIPERLAGE
jgi:hypothetical protein